MTFISNQKKVISLLNKTYKKIPTKVMVINHYPLTRQFKPLRFEVTKLSKRIQNISFLDMNYQSSSSKYATSPQSCLMPSAC